MREKSLAELVEKTSAGRPVPDRSMVVSPDYVPPRTPRAEEAFCDNGTESQLTAWRFAERA